MTKSALLVGINYIGTPNKLNGCINDVINMKNILLSKFGYTNITVLTDTSPKKPTKRNIQNELIKLVSNAKSGDTIIFHYSGHGSQIPDSSHDEKTNLDDVLIPIDYMTNGIIVDDWLNENICRKIPTGVTLYCFTDCCHSGTILDLQYCVNSNCVPKNGISPKNLYGKYIALQWTDQFSFNQEKSSGPIQGHVICFSGCLDAQTSADVNINGNGQGAFTTELLTTLSSNINSKQTLGDVLKEINAKLIMKGYTQRSELSISDLSVLNSTLNL